MSERAICVVAIDFETSAKSGPCACAVGMTKIENGGISRKFYSLIKPPSQEIMFSEVHGLYWDDLKDAPTFSELWPEISEFISGAQFLVAHNAAFDQNVLQECCAANWHAIPATPFLCTLRGARAKLKLDNYRLSTVAEHFKIPLTHHHAASDAIACAKIYLELLKLGLSQSAMELRPAPERPYVFPYKPY